MIYDRHALIRREKQGEELHYILFWGHTEKPGNVTKACLSQWYPCRFVSDGMEYCCTEQYMMAQKAILFGDRMTYKRIMASNQPREIKALGREISGFDQSEWDKNKYRIVLAGNVAKFSQNEPLKRFLAETGEAVLAEASPYDGVWGIGLSADSHEAKDVKCWKGENLLGFALMETRDLVCARSGGIKDER